MRQSRHTESATRTGAERLVEVLERLGVELVFGLPGVHNLPIWKALAASSIRLVGVRHEQTAVYAADGYARASGRLGVALVTTGPGAANTLGATGEAMASGSPVLVIATDIPSALRRAGVYRGVLHETRDQPAMFAPVTKRAETVGGADEIAQAVVDAAARACAAPSGPVYLGVPTDLLSQPAAAAELVAAAPEPHAAAEAELARALDLLADVRAPLVWAGGGALRADAGEAVGALALRLGAPVVTTYMARGLIAPDHPCHVPGPVHLPEVGRLWDEADLVVAIGTDFDGMMTQNWAQPAPARLLAVNVDRDEAAKAYRPDVTLVGDARAVVESLLERVPERADAAGLLAARLDGLAERVTAAVERDDPQAAELLAVMRETLPDDAVVVADMCIPGYWLGGFHRVPAPRRFAYPVGWGTLGFGFPAALGAALAGAGRAVAVCGDGGFLFACGELAAAAQEQLPLTVVLVDDGGYGMLRFDQVHAGEESFGVDLRTPDFVALAEAFGVPAWRERGFGAGFAARLEQSLSIDGPAMIVVDAALRPPPTTSPRWYRRAGASVPQDHQETTP